jgi:hypothetical protein
MSGVRLRDADTLSAVSYPTGVDRPPTPSRAAEAQRGRELELDKRDHRSLVLWATDCAEHVLPYFEEKYPKDNQPRNAVEAGRAWARGEIAMSEARAARAAATAHIAAHAAHAANYAVTAATDAAVVPTDSAAATAKERDWQYRRLPRHLRPEAFPTRGNT